MCIPTKDTVAASAYTTKSSVDLKKVKVTIPINISIVIGSAIASVILSYAFIASA